MQIRFPRACGTKYFVTIRRISRDGQEYAYIHIHLLMHEPRVEHDLAAGLAQYERISSVEPLPANAFLRHRTMNVSGERAKIGELAQAKSYSVREGQEGLFDAWAFKNNRPCDPANMIPHILRRISAALSHSAPEACV